MADGCGDVGSLVQPDVASASTAVTASAVIRAVIASSVFARCLRTDREWDFGSREAFSRWRSVGSTAWTGRLPEQDRGEFVADRVQAYVPIARRPGIQLRAPASPLALGGFVLRQVVPDDAHLAMRQAGRIAVELAVELPRRAALVAVRVDLVAVGEP